MIQYNLQKLKETPICVDVIIIVVDAIPADVGAIYSDVGAIPANVDVIHVNVGATPVDVVITTADVMIIITPADAVMTTPADAATTTPADAATTPADAVITTPADVTITANVNATAENVIAAVLVTRPTSKDFITVTTLATARDTMQATMQEPPSVPLLPLRSPYLFHSLAVNAPAEPLAVNLIRAASAALFHEKQKEP